MTNRRCSETAAELGWQPRRLMLDPGAMAELEVDFAARDLVDLPEWLEVERFSANDLATVIGAG